MLRRLALSAALSTAFTFGAGCAGEVTGEPVAIDKPSRPRPTQPVSDASTEPGPGPTASAADAGLTPRTGEELFVAFCSPCHGLQAEGTELGYELRHPDREYARWVVRNGRPGTEFENSVMAPFDEASLSDSELDAIFDYLNAFPQPKSGEALYLDYCGNCHGVDAAGGVVDVEITDRDNEDLLEKAREGEGGTNYASRDEYMRAFGTDVLSNAELRAIAEYVTSL